MPIGSHDFFDFGDQFDATVTDSWIAKLAEIGEVLSDLGIRKTKDLAKLDRTDRLATLPEQNLEFPQVKTESPDDCLGDIRKGSNAIGFFVFGSGFIFFHWKYRSVKEFSCPRVQEILE